MSVFIALLSLMGYSINNLLFAHYTRKIGSFTTVFYRAFSLCITMLPIPFIFGTDFSVITWQDIFNFLILWVLGGVGAIAHFESNKYLPIAISDSISRISTLIVMFLAFMVYGELITLLEAIWGVLILLSWILLSFVKDDHKHLENNRFLGIFWVVVRILAWAGWFFSVSYFGREVDVGLTAYFSEAFILLFLILMLPVSRRVYGDTLRKITFKDFFGIFFSTFTTVVATTSLVYATVIGSIAITNLILAAMPVATASLSTFVFGEKLKKVQWLLIGGTIIGLAILNI